MSRVELRAPVLEQGIRHTNFFNGRLLFAEDLFNETEANRAQHRQLGRACGDGVVHGLDVWMQASGAGGTVPVLRVSAGLAINRRGQSVELPRDTDVALERSEALPTGDAALFGACRTPAGVQVTIGAGAYLLVMSPVSGFSPERAPMSGLTAAGAISGCGSRYAIEGVQFRLEVLHRSGTNGPAGAAGVDLDVLAGLALPTGDSTFRNLLAHLCLGSSPLAGWSVNPAPVVAAGSPAGLLENLRLAKTLTDCDVPLAVIRWTGSGVQFVDTWAVRRSVARLEWGSSLSYVGEARHAIARATLLQFQLHLRALAASSASAAAVTAQTYFRYLPPCGIVPLQNAAFPSGFVQAQFFRDLAFGPPRPIAAAQLRPLLIDSLGHDAIDLSSRTRLQLYSIEENTAAQGGSSPPQPVLVFAAAALPYVSETPRFADLCQALRDASAAYYELHLRNAFLHNETSPEGIQAHTDISIAVLYLANLASARTPFTCAGGISVIRALETLKEMYDAQSAFAVLADQARPAAVLDSVKVREFGVLLKTYLDIVGDAGRPSLATALGSGDLARATAAQNEINQMIRTWSGAVTTGHIEVIYDGSSRGRTLVLNDPGRFAYTFRVTNRTNKRIAIQASASFPDRQAWNNSLTILDANSNVFGSATLEPADSVPAGDPRAFTMITASMTVPRPQDAALNDTGTLRLRAFAPAPIGVADEDEITLTVGNAEVADSDMFEFDTTVGASENLATAKVGRPITLTFGGFFRSPTAGSSKQAIFRVTLTGSTGDFTVTISGGVNGPGQDNANSTATVKVSPAFTINKDVRSNIGLRVVPGDNSLNRTLNITARLEAADATPAASSGPHAITVTQPRQP
jgi:hypothetical protein